MQRRYMTFPLRSSSFLVVAAALGERFVLGRRECKRTGERPTGRRSCASPHPDSCRRSPTNSRCLSIDTRSCWKLFHTFGDNFGQLHHLLSQLAVFRNIALNAIAVGV